MICLSLRRITFRSPRRAAGAPHDDFAKLRLEVKCSACGAVSSCGHADCVARLTQVRECVAWATITFVCCGNAECD